jgi:glutamine amidotransferase
MQDQQLNKKLSIAIIDYDSGNLHSAKKAVQKALENSTREGEVFLTNKHSDLSKATHIILPGVGAFGDCYDGLNNLDSMIDTLKNNILVQKKPFLGICVGMQLLADEGFEAGGHKGLGWIKGKVDKISFNDSQENQNLRIPHMGWNNLIIIDSDNPLFKDLPQNPDFYFVHSYYFDLDEDCLIANVQYGQEITAAIQKDNIFGVQFHPEKSQSNGIKLLQNFIEI